MAASRSGCYIVVKKRVTAVLVIIAAPSLPEFQRKGKASVGGHGAGLATSPLACILHVKWGNEAQSFGLHCPRPCFQCQFLAQTPPDHLPVFCFPSSLIRKQNTGCRDHA